MLETVYRLKDSVFHSALQYKGPLAKSCGSYKMRMCNVKPVERNKQQTFNENSQFMQSCTYLKFFVIYWFHPLNLKHWTCVGGEFSLNWPTAGSIHYTIFKSDVCIQQYMPQVLYQPVYPHGSVLAGTSPRRGMYCAIHTRPFHYHFQEA